MTSAELLPSKAAPLAPDRLGVYRIESLLGRGGMGEVLLAWDEILERHVAIKQVSSFAGADVAGRQRFRREARAVARLDHPAIVRVYHVLEREGGDCLVMEYVKGQDLAKLTAGGRVDPFQALLLARGIAEGLAEAHAAGLVHRDLKPANVMVTLSGGVKILDFGLAKARERMAGGDLDAPGPAPAASPDLTLEGAIVGTAFAMSPEQARGEELDFRSDLFSLGSLLYELLAGKRPFQGVSLAEILRRVVAAEPVPVEDLVPSLPSEVADLVKRLLARERQQRPPSAQAVADQLTRTLERLGVSPHSAIPRHATRFAAARPGDAVGDEPTAQQPQPPLGLPARPPPTVVLRTVVCLAVAEDGDRNALRRCAEKIVSRFDAQKVEGDGIDFLFRRPAEAVAFALALHAGLANRSPPLFAGIALHLGEVILTGAFGRVTVAGHPEPLAFARVVAGHARGGQTLLSRTVFDLARGARAPAALAQEAVRWLAHGRFYAAGETEATELFEVGVAGLAPLGLPLEGPGLRRAQDLSQDLALGWRPAVGQEVPRRPGWRLAERLGEGGFGEVWLAREDDREERVFKFCFDPARLRALKREVTIFRLLRETLGHRPDIARLISWDFEEAPFFLESAYTDGGDLIRWAGQRGGLAEIPLATRLDLVTQVAEALAAAHSVGVLHKDVKPQNVLVGHDGDGRPRAVLTDFGLGLLTRREALERPGFTVLGFTESSPEPDFSKAGTARYMAPELLAGDPATVAADVYSLGVLLYQMAVGDFGRGPAEGWRREIADELLAADVAACVDGSPDRRLRSPAELAERLRSLEERRLQLQQEQAAAAAARRAQRRRRAARWLGGTAAVLVPLLSAFAFTTYQAKNEESRARRQAEQRRQQAESLIDFMLGDLRQQLQPIGKLKILDQVGDRALDYFAKVPEGDLSQPELASYAKALHQIGEVRFALGKKPEAAEAFAASLAMAKRLAATDPANGQWQFDLGQSHYWVGFLRWKERKSDQALAEFAEYLRISEGLVARDPSNRDWQLELAYSHSNIASIQEELGELESASLSLEAALRIFGHLLQLEPRSTRYLKEAATASVKLGELLHQSGNLESALAQHRAALRDYETALETDADDAELLLLASSAKSYVGGLLQEMGETAEAYDFFQDSLKILQGLAKRDPNSYTYKEQLSLATNRVGRADLAAGKLRQARKMLDVDRRLSLELTAKSSATPGWRLARARNHCSWALIHLETGSPSSAIGEAEAGRAELADLAANSQNRTFRLWLARTHLVLGLAHRDLGENEKATLRLQEGARIARVLVEDHPLPFELDVYVRLLIGSGNRSLAEPSIDRLAHIGYHEAAYRAFLECSAGGTC